MMNLMHWRLLVAVADCANITRAAEQVGMTQSGASQAIALLEDHLQVSLFSREHRSTLPTAVGLEVVAQARLMLAALDGIRQCADAARGAQRATVRLASFPMVLANLLPPLLRRLRQRHPGIQVVALEASDSEVEAMLAADTADLGVVLNPGPGRQTWPLGREQWCVVVPRNHRWGAGPVALAALVGEPFVLATGGCSVNARSIALDAGHALADVRVEVRDWSTAFALVREQLGVTLVPQMTLPVERQGLRVLELNEPIYREFALAASPAGLRCPAVQALLRTLAEPH
ncbi:LysR family transcriptional regulator [Pseudomonas abieticivorans]|uniref:LysR family transcriptional regulator n=1 Tax=Pseudomonas abieticivorans TaxID=2931382 RepID=UPI0020BE1635|nr:LysR family transcriptional regulator [Pseudomonas sp. PIA16]